MSNNKRRLHISQSFPLSSETYAWLLLSKLTTRVTSQALNWEIVFLPICFFPSLSPCWFFIRGSECRMLPSYVLYKGTYVPYKRTFGTPDQGQMLDVWGSIQQMSTLRWRWHSYAEKSPPHPGMKSCTSKDIAKGISAMILDHTDRN